MSILRKVSLHEKIRGTKKLRIKNHAFSAMKQLPTAALVPRIICIALLWKYASS
jgi:hypothetical protein